MPSEPDKYEKRDANAKWILCIIIGLFVFGIAVQGFMGGVLKRLNKMPYASDNWRPVARMQKETPIRPPYPELQVSPALDLKIYREREEAELNSYGWVNRASGIVRIPVQRAMEVVLEQGLPTRLGANQGKAGPSSLQLQQERPDHHEPEIQGEK